MNLSEKLKIFLSNNPTEKRNPMVAMQKSRFSPEVIGGTTVGTPFGEHVVVKKKFDGFYKHGDEKLDSVFNISPEILKLMSKNCDFDGFDFNRAIFIDTETTGLAGGTGTLAFLIGVGFFDSNGFKIIQYFMRDYDEEAAVLYSLGNLLAQFDGLVSFNGKSYDIPLLTTRYTLNRMENPIDKFLHLDLLSAARRVYRERLKSVSLSSLETNLLSLKREGDIPGFQIPAVYFRFLRDKNPYPLKPIFYHNRMDILSMVTLAISIAKSFDRPFESETCAEQDYYCLGRVFEDMGMIERSIKCYQKALNVPGVREKSYRQLSMLYKRLGNWCEAEKLWIRMAEGRINTIFALVELAKYYEHRLKDYDRAAVVTQRALEVVYKKNCLVGITSSDEVTELKKRLKRIERKRKNM